MYFCFYCIIVFIILFGRIIVYEKWDHVIKSCKHTDWIYDKEITAVIFCWRYCKKIVVAVISTIVPRYLISLNEVVQLLVEYYVKISYHKISFADRFDVEVRLIASLALQMFSMLWGCCNHLRHIRIKMLLLILCEILHSKNNNYSKQNTTVCIDYWMCNRECMLYTVAFSYCDMCNCVYHFFAIHSQPFTIGMLITPSFIVLFDTYAI